MALSGYNYRKSITVTGAGDAETDKVLQFIILRGTPETWRASWSFGTNDCILVNSIIYQCTVAGISGAEQPAWSTTNDATTVDGTVTWTCRRYWTYLDSDKVKSDFSDVRITDESDSLLGIQSFTSVSEMVMCPVFESEIIYDDSLSGIYSASAYNSSGRLYIGVGTKLMYSDDDGALTLDKDFVDFGAWTDAQSGAARFGMLYCTKNTTPADIVFASPFMADAAGVAGLYRKNPSTGAWSRVLIPTTPSNATGAGLCIWGFDEDSSGNLYASLYGNSSGERPKLYKSIDLGVTWSAVYDDATANTKHIHQVGVDRYNGDAIYITLGDEVYPDKVIGSDANIYVCKQSHVAADDNKPITGANWETYWELTAGGGIAWVATTNYRAGKLRKSTDGGVTFLGICNRASTDSATYTPIPQPTGIIITPTARILVDDTGARRTYRTTDDIVYTTINCYKLSGTSTGVGLWGRYDDTNAILYAGFVAPVALTPALFASFDDGLHWNLVKNGVADSQWEGYEWSPAVKAGTLILSRSYFPASGKTSFAYRINPLSQRVIDCKTSLPTNGVDAIKYLCFGNSVATEVYDPADTAFLWDDFLGAAYDTDKWDVFQKTPPTNTVNITVADSKIQLSMINCTAAAGAEGNGLRSKSSKNKPMRLLVKVTNSACGDSGISYPRMLVGFGVASTNGNYTSTAAFANYDSGTPNQGRWEASTSVLALGVNGKDNIYLIEAKTAISSKFIGYQVHSTLSGLYEPAAGPGDPLYVAITCLYGLTGYTGDYLMELDWIYGVDIPINNPIIGFGDTQIMTSLGGSMYLDMYLVM